MLGFANLGAVGSKLDVVLEQFQFLSGSEEPRSREPEPEPEAGGDDYGDIPF